MIVKTDPDLIEPYLTDASHFPGAAEKLYIPETTEELKQAIRECYESETPATISGAGTGLTGARCPLGGAIISTERLTKTEINPEKNRAVLSPGVLIADFEKELDRLGKFYPPHPTERNSAIGGNVATNASGAKSFKYGATREFIERLEIALADGDELSLRRGENFAIGRELKLLAKSGRTIDLKLPDLKLPNSKHAAGYFVKPDMDAIDLFIGSEGTLGVVTEVELRILDKPEELFGGIVFFKSSEEAVEFVRDAVESTNAPEKSDNETGRKISPRLLEFFDEKALNLLRKKYPNIKKEFKAAIWFERECEAESVDESLAEWYGFIAGRTDFADETWIALTDKEREEMREFRHALPVAVGEITAANGFVKIGTDVSVPFQHIEAYWAFLDKKLNETPVNFVVWGHMGDAHFHANLLPKSDKEKSAANKFYARAIEKALNFGGTFSAEHGVGKIKKKYLEKMFGKEGIEGMRGIKQSFDPRYLLGKGNFFD